MVEQGIHVVAVGAGGGCRHPQEERRNEVVQDCPIAGRPRPVGFVDDDVVELPRVEVVQMPAQRADHGKHAGRKGFCETASVQGVGIAASQHPLEAFLGSLQDTVPMSHEQDPAGTNRPNVQRGKVCLTRSRCRDQKGPPLLAAVQHLQRIQGQGLHLVGNDARQFGRSCSGRRRRRLARPERGPAFQPLPLPRLCAKCFVALDPFLGHGNGVVVVPHLLVLPSDLMEHIAAREGLEQHVPFLVAGQSVVGQVRAAHDDGRYALLFEKVALGVKVSLVNAGLDVRKLQELPQRVWIVEVVQSGGQDSAAHSLPLQLVQDLDQHLDAAGRNKGHREVEALARGKLRLDNGKNVCLLAGAVAHDPRGVALVGLDAGVYEARPESVGKVDDVVLHVSHRSFLR